MLPRFSIFSQFFSPVLCDEQATKKTAAKIKLQTAKNLFFIYVCLLKTNNKVKLKTYNFRLHYLKGFYKKLNREWV